jgi:hypothetical protein
VGKSYSSESFGMMLDFIGSASDRAFREARTAWRAERQAWVLYIVLAVVLAAYCLTV